MPYDETTIKIQTFWGGYVLHILVTIMVVIFMLGITGYAYIFRQGRALSPALAWPLAAAIVMIMLGHEFSYLRDVALGLTVTGLICVIGGIFGVVVQEVRELISKVRPDDARKLPKESQRFSE